MQKAVVVAIGVACAGAFALVSPAFGEFVVGVDTGATVPISAYRHSVDAGGAVGLWGGYGLDLTDWLWAGVVLDPRFTFFSADELAAQKTSSLFSVSGGPRLTAGVGNLEASINALGGLYTDLGGVFHDTGGGWNASGGVNYYLVPRLTSLGVFVRYDWSSQQAAFGSSANREFISAGLTVQHRFLQPPPAVAQVQEPAPAPAPTPPPKQKLVLRGVHFDFDKADIRADAKPVLDEAIHTLEQYRDINISVDGYTDSVGTDAYNLKLSERRAKAVADYLAKGGIARSRLSVKGYGEASPVASNDTADGRAQNRRVELRVSGN